ncbi:MAG: transposase [Nitrosotalea sp.]
MHSLPDRRTFDRRFKVLPARDMIGTMGARFVTERLTGTETDAVDSTMIAAKGGKVWHKSDMRKNRIPRPGIDTDARWGFSRTRGWLFGYKLHMVSSTGRIIVPLSADISTANVSDNHMYCSLVESLQARYVVADLGYDDHKLYDYSRYRGMRLVCPIRRYRHTKGDRLKMISFYKSRKGQSIYRNRSVSIEPLFECVKNTFGISVSPVRGFENVSSYLLMCVFVYQVAVYYNCIMDNENPRCVKRMLGN